MAKRTVIVNLQKTPYDQDAHLRIFAYCDPVLRGLRSRLAIDIDPVPMRSRHTSLPGKKTAGGQKKQAPAPPASAKSMRAHILATASRAGVAPPAREIELAVEPASVGVSVKGRQVVRVKEGSQAEVLGVKEGWLLSHIDGKEMPHGGKVAADAITRALAGGKSGGRRYTIKFQVPRSPAGAKAAEFPISGAMKGGSSQKPHANTSTAFGAFSSGLCASGAALIEAHHNMLGMAEEMAGLEIAGAC